MDSMKNQRVCFDSSLCIGRFCYDITKFLLHVRVSEGLPSYQL